MKILYLDCISGLSGDMFLSGLVDLGLPVRVLAEGLDRLHLGKVRLRFPAIRQKSIRARRLVLTLPRDHHRAGGASHSHPPHEHAHRSYREIDRLIRKSSLPQSVKARSFSIFEVLARAEGKVHGVHPSKVEFHEVGAMDSIIDIVGAAIGLDYFHVDRILCSPIPVGRGTVETQHGRYPVPAPATLELLRGFPLAEHPDAGEWTTPTGAAIVNALAEPSGGIPRMTVTRVGYGSGTQMGKSLPNVVRIVEGTMGDSKPVPAGVERDEAWVVETDIDDMTPEMCAPLMDRLFERGALDVQWISTHMKRGRPGFRLEILAAPSDRDALVQMLFEESSTIGARFYKVERMKLPRRTVTLRTGYGPIRLKVSSQNGRVLSAKPEMADLLRAAEKHHEPLPRVLRSIQRAVDRHVRSL